jgi:penicillin-binding protein 1A
MKVAQANQPPKEFQVPEGINLIPINRHTGLPASGEGKDVILEAFKPGTSPPTSFSVIGYQDSMGQPAAASISPDANRAIATGTGGLY